MFDNTVFFINFYYVLKLVFAQKFLLNINILYNDTKTNMNVV